MYCGLYYLQEWRQNTHKIAFQIQFVSSYIEKFSGLVQLYIPWLSRIKQSWGGPTLVEKDMQVIPEVLGFVVSYGKLFGDCIPSWVEWIRSWRSRAPSWFTGQSTLWRLIWCRLFVISALTLFDQEHQLVKSWHCIFHQLLREESSNMPYFLAEK